MSLTHAIAGPVVGRTLAEQGADVLCVNHYDDFEHDWVFDDANVGQRSTCLDLKDSTQNEICRNLVRTADVFVLFAIRLWAECGGSRQPSPIRQRPPLGTTRSCCREDLVLPSGKEPSCDQRHYVSGKG